MIEGLSVGIRLTILAIRKKKGKLGILEPGFNFAKSDAFPALRFFGS